VAAAIVDVVQKFGGVLSLEDLKSHVTTMEEPISTDYRGYRLWEIPPNGHGMAALMTLNILEEYNISGNTDAFFQMFTAKEIILVKSQNKWF